MSEQKPSAWAMKAAEELGKRDQDCRRMYGHGLTQDERARIIDREMRPCPWCAELADALWHLVVDLDSAETLGGMARHVLMAKAALAKYEARNA